MPRGSTRQLWVARDDGLLAVDLANLDAEGPAIVGSVATRLHTLSSELVLHRQLKAAAPRSRDAQRSFNQRKRQTAREATGDANLVQSLDDVLGPTSSVLARPPKISS